MSRDPEAWCVRVESETGVRFLSATSYDDAQYLLHVLQELSLSSSDSFSLVQEKMIADDSVIHGWRQCP